jgi:SWI/SNF-related matrix-associated actin-dependent regulator 1 of chromatin subfamily A
VFGGRRESQGHDVEKLFAFQETGVDWLSDRRFALLADEMGLGKSAQTIRAADNVLAGRILVICPAVAKVNWEREFEKFGLFSRKMLVGSTTFQLPRAGESYICSYERAVAINRTNPAWWKGRFDLLILDESHFAKNPEASRTQEILGSRTFDGRQGLIHYVDKVWAISGTPMPNHPGELWVLLKTFGRTTLAYNSFCAKYCDVVPGYKNQLRVLGMKKGAEKELRELLAPVMLRRTVAEVMPELPPLRFCDLVVEPGSVELPPERLQEVLDQDAWLSKMLLDENGQIAPEKMQLLEALANSVSTLRLYNGLQKVAPVSKLIDEELSSGAYPKVVIFGCHTLVLKRMYDNLKHHGAGFIIGATSEIARQRDIDAFQTDPKMRVMICNIKAAGTSISLTAADQEVFVEAEWSPGPNQQAARRCRRIGSTRPVLSRFVGIANSIDEKVQKTNRRKTRDIDLVLNA